MEPAEYEAWYATARGRWIGETEFNLASRVLSTRPSETLLDVGCGTGWFTRRFAQQDLHVTGLDPSPNWLAFARAHSDPTLRWVEGDAQALPFPMRALTMCCPSPRYALWRMNIKRWPKSYE